ncbi:hypothetical protein ANCDUO_00401 [Ancylostoma duodenale]|uniref:Uncharacterized protein n=1 Tax=Ancylostoma duodenale TaxID=51022 RepID=A0A0C2H5X1_9BILA|nr:hypothetical protein ANCDUO_00401 [Ancylostoma duodenale]
MNIYSFKQLTIRIGRLRLRRCGSIPALTIFVVYAPTSSYGEEGTEAFCMDLEKFYAGFWQDAVVDNIDKEYDRLAQHLRDSAKEAVCSRAIERRLSYNTLELIRQHGAARAASNNYQLTPKLAKR